MRFHKLNSIRISGFHQESRLGNLSTAGCTAVLYSPGPENPYPQGIKSVPVKEQKTAPPAGRAVFCPFP